MVMLNRRHFSTLALGALASPALLGRARAAGLTLSYANNMPVSHPMNIRAAEAAEAIMLETDGRIDLKIFPSSQLGGDTDVISQLRTGAIDFYSGSGAQFQSLNPVMAITTVGYAFPDDEAAFAACDGALGAYLRGQFDSLGLIAMEKIWASGFRHMTTSSRQITTPDDLVGLKMRVAMVPILVSMFEALDSSTVALNVSEVYSALQTKVVDGQENPLSTIDAFKFYEVQKNISLTRHCWDAPWFLANKSNWEAMSAAEQEVIARHVNAAGLAVRADIAKSDDALLSGLEALGMAIAHPEVAAFRAKLSGASYYTTWKEKFGSEAWSLLEQVTGSLT